MDIGPEKVQNLLIIVLPECLLIVGLVQIEVEIQEIFWTIILIHADVIKSKLDLDIAFC